MPTKLQPESFLHRFVDAAHAAAFRVVEYGTAGGFPLLAAELSPECPRMSVYLSAGIHGDEPAGPFALLSLMLQKWFDPEIAWHVLPLLNPTGMATGTRDSAISHCDLNRDFRSAAAVETRAHLNWLQHYGHRYDLGLFLHEDWEAQGFYLYEMRKHGEPELAWNILQSVEPVTGVDYSAEIDGLPAKNGLLRPHLGTSIESVEQWPEQLFLQHHLTAQSLTFETPSAMPLPARVMAQIVAIKTAVNHLLAPRVEGAFEI